MFIYLPFPSTMVPSLPVGCSPEPCRLAQNRTGPSEKHLIEEKGRFVALYLQVVLGEKLYVRGQNKTKLYSCFGLYRSILSASSSCRVPLYRADCHHCSYSNSLWLAADGTVAFKQGHIGGGLCWGWSSTVEATGSGAPVLGLMTPFTITDLCPQKSWCRAEKAHRGPGSNRWGK